MHLDGSSLGPGDLDKTFAGLGITEKCFLLNVLEADNARFSALCLHRRTKRSVRRSI